MTGSLVRVNLQPQPIPALLGTNPVAWDQANSSVWTLRPGRDHFEEEL
jgi:hypothetical protein